MKTLTFRVYSIDELSTPYKQTVILDHLDFLQNTSYINDTEEEIEARKLISFNDAYDNIKVNEYLYFENGKLISPDDYKNVKDEN